MELERRLGFGKDGSVFATSIQSAVKVYLGVGPFERELECYRRLRDEKIDLVLGHRVPRLLRWDDQLLVVEMSIVKPPYVLDFAGAYLDDAPDFPPEVMEQWREEKAEQFGPHWPEIEALTGFFESRLGIHLLDVHPGNITFAETSDPSSSS